MSIGENIKNIRNNRGFTQCWLAEQIGVSSSMMSQIERGTKIPTIILGNEIAKVLSCRLDDLLEGEK